MTKMGARRAGVAADVVDPPTWRRRGQWIMPVGTAVCYATLTVAVHLNLLNALDVDVRSASRPGGVWGPLQVRAARLAHELDPPRVGSALLLVVAVYALLVRSSRPLAVTAVVSGPVSIVTLGTKWIMAHLDSGTTPVDHASYPSGHTVSVMMVFGVVLLLYRPVTRWSWALPGLMGFLIGSALILAGIHPATDVTGGALLATAALTAARATGLGDWAAARALPSASHVPAGYAQRDTPNTISSGGYP